MVRRNSLAAYCTRKYKGSVQLFPKPAGLWNLSKSKEAHIVKTALHTCQVKEKRADGEEQKGRKGVFRTYFQCLIRVTFRIRLGKIQTKQRAAAKPH